jgi:nucleoside-specific outer membrane channel protein Tsx
MVTHCEVKPGICSAAGTLDMTEVIKLRVEYYALRDLNRRRWGAFDCRIKAWFATRQESAEENKGTLHTVTPYI